MVDGRDVALMAHLMRRAGFAASRDEIEALAAQGYEETVEQFLHPELQPDLDEALFYRYHPMAEFMYTIPHGQLNWLFRMVNTARPLQEKTLLFWHQVFATGNDKVINEFAMHTQIEMFRANGMGNYRDLLVRLAKDPAMIYWLDNQDNHKRTPNENWGRELLELFSLGVGHYTEKDVFECARAFTGWTFTSKISGIRVGPLTWRIEYRPEDHDHAEKTFLGHTGNLNAEDIIDIIVQQPECTGFIARQKYNFFVADEPEVPKWPNEPPSDPKAIELLSSVFVDSGFEVLPVLRALFNSDFFKEAMYRKVKSPAEVVVGTLKLSGDMNGPDPRWGDMYLAPRDMGQDLLNPPSVEGWHTGKEWINSGALINRVNFVADRFRDTALPGVKAMVERIGANGVELTPEDLVDRSLCELGPLPVDDDTYEVLVAHVAPDAPIALGTDEKRREFSHRVGDLFALIAGTKEYQLG